MWCYSTKYRNIWSTSFLHFIYFLSQSNIECILLSEPEHTVGREGDTIQLRCQTNLSVVVNWSFNSSTTGSETPKTIFGKSGDGKGVIYHDFQERFTVKKEEGGWYNLIISNASFSDGGNYTCIDNEGFAFGRWDNARLWASVHLVIIDSELNCEYNISNDGTVGGDLCELGLQPDCINMTCSIIYRGNVAPSLLWNKVINDQYFTSDFTNKTSNNMVVISTVVRRASDDMNGIQFICSASMIWNITTMAPVDLNITWRSPAIELLFRNTSMTLTSISKQDSFTCRARTNMRECRYSWQKLGTQSVVKSDILKLSDFSETKGCTRFQCSAECPIRGKICHISNVTLAESYLCSVETSDVVPGIISVISFIILLVICIIVVIVVYKYCNRRNRRNQRNAITKRDQNMMPKEDPFLMRDVVSANYPKVIIPDVEDLDMDTGVQSEISSDIDPSLIHTLADLDLPDTGVIIDPSVTFTPPLIHVLTPGGRIYGVTVLDSQIYIIRSTGSSVIVEAYNTDNFIQNKNSSISMPAVKEFGDITSCSKNKCLYISDTFQELVHKCGGNIISLSWSVGVKCDKLSVTKSCNVLVTLPYEKLLKEYTTNGQQLRVIHIDPIIDFPRHCIELSTGQFVVSNGCKNEERAGVYIVSSSGVINDFIGGHWQNAVHIAVDKYDNILMVDECFKTNNKVKVLTAFPALKYLEDILIPGDYKLKGPSSLHLDEQNNRLYIGEDSGGRLFVLNTRLAVKDDFQLTSTLIDVVPVFEKDAHPDTHPDTHLIRGLDSFR